MRETRKRGTVALLLAAVMAFGACSDTGSEETIGTTEGADTTDVAEATGGAGDTTPSPTTGDDNGTDTTDDGTAAAGADCASAPQGEPWTDGPSVAMETLQEPTAGTAGVAAALYPHPDYPAKLWSQWGQGIVADDGRVFSALGDHEGVDGNSFFYVYDPAAGTLTQIADAQTVVGHTAGDWGFGKVHAQMVEGPCGDIYTSTYWGTDRDLEFNERYQGDHLVRIDPATETIADGGLILAEHGVASMASVPATGLLYAEGRDPFGQRQGPFLVIDATSGETVHNETIEGGGYRSIAVDTEGRAYFTWDVNGLAVYDPVTNTVTPTDIAKPPGRLRAVTEPDTDGVIYGVTQRPDEKFALHPDGTVVEMGSLPGYVSSIAMDPDGSRWFYIPHAHGGAFADGAPLIAVDTATGEEEVVVELNDLFVDHFGMNVGGTYNLRIDATGEHVYAGVNIGPTTDRSAWGDVAFVDITLP